MIVESAKANLSFDTPRIVETPANRIAMMVSLSDIGCFTKMENLPRETHAVVRAGGAPLRGLADEDLVARRDRPACRITASSDETLRAFARAARKRSPASYVFLSTRTRVD